MRTKKLLFIIILIFLFFPLLQEYLGTFPVKPLKGAVVNHRDTTFTWSEWMNGTFQPVKEKYVNEKFGLRNIFLRVNNEIKFDLFGKVYARDVIVGKEKYLFEKNYIKAYNGDDFIGADSIKEISAQLKFIQDELKKINIDFVVVLAPGKASFFPEYIPDKMRKPGNATNYKMYSKELKEMQVNLVDFNHWFVEMKTKSPYPLYPKCGIHWSVYGYTIATDSLVHYIESLRQVDLADIKINSIQLSDEYKDTDYDLGDGLNLVFDIPNYKMGYPEITVTREGKTRPKAVIIGDSYYWNIFGSGLDGKIFDNPRFWYYYEQLYHAAETTYRETKDLDFKEELTRNNVVILLSTEGNLSRLGWGFIHDAYNYFKSMGEWGYGEKRISEIENSIRETPSWFKLVSDKAAQRNISLDSMIYLDALYVYKEELMKRTSK